MNAACDHCPCPSRCRRVPALCERVATDREGALWRRHVCAERPARPAPAPDLLPSPEEALRIVAEIERLLAGAPPPRGGCCG